MIAVTSSAAVLCLAAETHVLTDAGQLNFFLGRQAADPGPTTYKPVSADLGFTLTIPGDWNPYEETASNDAIHLTQEILKDHQSRYKTGISIFRLEPQTGYNDDLMLTFREIDLRMQALISNGFIPTDAGIVSDTVEGYWIKHHTKDFHFIDTYIAAKNRALWVVLKSDKKNYKSNSVIYDNILSKLEPL